MAVLTTGSATEQDGIDLIDEVTGIVWHNIEGESSRARPRIPANAVRVQ